MHYIGGKFRLRKQIGTFIKSIIEKETSKSTYIEPFVGGLWTFSEVVVNTKIQTKIANDICYPLINLYRNLQSGLSLPDNISEDTYTIYNKLRDESDPLLAFVGFGCSFSGKYFGGYARDGSGRNYAKNAKNSLLKKFKNLDDVIFTCQDYVSLTPKDSIIYCDPPYLDTTKYDYSKDSFDHVLFWKTMEKWVSEGNTVIVSEYVCGSPKFSCVLEMHTKTDIRTKNGKEDRVEKLFMSKE